MRLISLLFILTSCSELSGLGITQQHGVGFGAGVVAAKTATEIKKSLTPQYKLGLTPQALCKKEQNKESVIKCFIVPCFFEENFLTNCSVNYSPEEFWELNGVVELLFTSSRNYVEIKRYCLKYPDSCIQNNARFKDKIVLIKVQKED